MTSLASSNIKLHKYESFCYFFLWTGAAVYSTYKVSLISTYFDNYSDPYGDFAPGWIWIGRKQDVSDQEWRIWIPLMIKLIPWMFAHHFVGHIIRRKWNSMVLCCWYILISILFIYFCIGPLALVCALMQLSILYIITYKCCRFTIWLSNILFLFLIHFLKTPGGVFQNILKLNDEEHYILILVICWNQLRCISYSIDNTESHVENKYDNMYCMLKNYIYKLAYCLYLPTLSLGPLVLYQEFTNSMQNEPTKSTRLGNIILNLIRYIFWIIFANFFLHFLYFNALQYHPEAVENLNVWALYGSGYCMGQFFLIKYVVVYGLNRILCELDNIRAPSQPKCVARIHLYSDMWKYFDQGLYKFLVRYIYVPSLRAYSNKLVASFLCFTFVFMWHGMQKNIFIWAFLNFVGLNLESLIRSAEESIYYLKMIDKKYISSSNTRRFSCILTSPLLAISVISNFYFFAGEEIGNIYIHRILHDGWSTTFTLLFFLYCCCQVSIDIKQWESQRYSLA